MERRGASGPPTGFSAANQKGRSSLFISRFWRWLGNSKSAWRFFCGGLVFGFARARLGRVVDGYFREDFGPQEGGFWSWFGWVARGGFQW